MNLRAIGNKQFYLDLKQLAVGNFIWISEQSAVGNLSALAIRMFPLKTVLEPPKPSENEAPDCPKIEHKSFKRMSYQACPFSRPLLRQRPGWELPSKIRKTDPPKNRQKIDIFHQGRLPTSKTLRKRGPGPLQNRSQFASYLKRPETQE